MSLPTQSDPDDSGPRRGTRHLPWRVPRLPDRCDPLTLGILLHLWHHFREEGFAESVHVAFHQIGIMERRQTVAPKDFRRAIAERHHHNHGLDLPLSIQIIENDVRTPHRCPGVRSVAVTVQKAQHGIELTRPWVIARRRINIVIAIIPYNSGVIEMMMNDSMCYVIHLPGQR